MQCAESCVLLTFKQVFCCGGEFRFCSGPICLSSMENPLIWGCISCGYESHSEEHQSGSRGMVPWLGPKAILEFGYLPRGHLGAIQINFRLRDAVVLKRSQKGKPIQK